MIAAARDHGTRILQRVRPPAAFPTLFARAFPQIDELYRAFEGDGVLLLALSEAGQLESYVHMPVDVEPSYAVIGRHSRCDLMLPGDPSVSLRHAVVGARRVGLCDLRLRLWDLDSGVGVQTEAGDSCAGLVTEGPLFCRLGTYSLLCLPTGALAPLPWGTTAEEAWASFPERVIRDLRRPTRSTGPRTPLRDERARAHTLVVRGPALLRTCPRPRPNASAPVGRLEMTAGREVVDIRIEEDELDNGILIGRYDRCTLSAAQPGVSRLHLLLTRDAGATWAIDLSSTNGTTLGGVSMRQVRLDHETELALGAAAAVHWQPEDQVAHEAVYNAAGGR